MKKVISLLLTAVLIIGMLPLSAVAASTPEEALGELDIYSGGSSAWKIPTLSENT